MCYINDDLQLLNDERIVRKETTDIAIAFMIEAEATKYGYDKYQDPAYPCMHKMIKVLLDKHPVIIQDNKYGLRAENFIAQEHDGYGERGSVMTGFHRMDHGLAFYGFIAGGDEQRSAFAIVYHDGEDLRLYVPVVGNKINAMRQEVLTHDKRSEKYIRRYGLTPQTVCFDWFGIRLDILANIKMDYESVRANR